MTRIAALAALVTTLLTSCSQTIPCPSLSSNDDGTYTIGTPPPEVKQRSDLAGCEYEFDESGTLTTERDTDG